MSDLHAAVERVRAFLTACPDTVDAIATLHPLQPAGDPIPLRIGDLHALLAAADHGQQPIASILARTGHAIDNPASEQRHQPLTDQPCGHVPTQRGMDYLAVRRRQHPKGAEQ